MPPDLSCTSAARRAPVLFPTVLARPDPEVCRSLLPVHPSRCLRRSSPGGSDEAAGSACVYPRSPARMLSSRITPVLKPRRETPGSNRKHQSSTTVAVFFFPPSATTLSTTTVAKTKMAPKVPRRTGTTTEVPPSSTKIAVYNYCRLGLRQVHRRTWFRQDHLEYDYTTGTQVPCTTIVTRTESGMSEDPKYRSDAPSSTTWTAKFLHR